MSEGIQAGQYTLGVALVEQVTKRITETLE